MWQRKNRLDAALILTLVLAAAGLIAGSAAVAPTTSLAADTLAFANSGANGKQVFQDQRCSNCHSLKSQGIEAKFTSGPMAGGSLDGVGRRHDAGWIVQYVKHETQQGGKNHKGPQPRASNQELQSMASWLVGLSN